MCRNCEIKSTWLAYNQKHIIKELYLLDFTLCYRICFLSKPESSNYHSHVVRHGIHYNINLISMKYCFCLPTLSFKIYTLLELLLTFFLHVNTYIFYANFLTYLNWLSYSNFDYHQKSKSEFLFPGRTWNSQTKMLQAIVQQLI